MAPENIPVHMHGREHLIETCYADIRQNVQHVWHQVRQQHNTPPGRRLQQRHRWLDAEVDRLRQAALRQQWRQPLPRYAIDRARVIKGRAVAGLVFARMA